MILIKNTQKKIPLNKNKIKSKIKRILQFLNLKDFDIGIWFTTNQTIRKYNQKFRKINKSTDILSFPYHSNLKPNQKIDIKMPEDKNLGDIIISAEKIKSDAIELHKNFDSYLLKILIHGISHLLGYDHKTEKQFEQMHKFELSIQSHFAKTNHSIQ